MGYGSCAGDGSDKDCGVLVVAIGGLDVAYVCGGVSRVISVADSDVGGGTDFVSDASVYGVDYGCGWDSDGSIGGNGVSVVGSAGSVEFYDAVGESVACYVSGGEKSIESDVAR